MMKSKWFVLLAVSMMAAVIDLDLTIVNLAIPAIATHFLKTLTDVQWVGSIYSIMALLVLILGGVMADRVMGKKKVYLIGISFFLVGSLAAAFAPSFSLIILGRAIQGIGFGLTIGLGAVILTEVFPKGQTGLALGVYMTSMGGAQALGPSIGGWILTGLSWKWIFLINVPFCLVSYLFIATSLSGRFEKSQTKPFDWVGFLLFSFLMIGLIEWINKINHESAKAFSIYLWEILTLVALFAFYIWEKRHAHPFINLKLFSSPSFVLTTAIRVVNLYIWGSILFIIPLYFQNILGFSSSKTGLLLVAMTCVFALTSPFIGRLTDRIGFLKPTVFSILIMLLSLFLLLFLQQSSLTLILFALMLVGLSSGIIATTSVGMISSSSSEKHSGQSMGLFYTFMLLGFSLGIAFSSVMIKSIAQKHFIKKALPLFFNSSMDLASLQKFASGVFPLHLLPPRLQALCLESFHLGFRYMIGTCLLLTLTALFLSQKLAKYDSQSQVLVE